MFFQGLGTRTELEEIRKQCLQLLRYIINQSKVQVLASEGFIASGRELQQ